MISLTKTIAIEHAPTVRANAVAPAAVDTEFLRGGTVAEDIVGPALFLLSPASAYMTGQVLYVNGGMITP